MSTPQLTPEQRLAALEKAKQARVRRRQVKDAVASGATRVSEVLASQEQSVRRMPVVDLVSSVRGYGRPKALKLMSDLGISERRRVQGLGHVQREALCRKLG